ncbi:hypothetical protein Golob_011072 [Gossypium lobatum]|uniref:Uncharacterized protein n=1 Tax=Gossypium lobatum TaxID=34289 RepID=A0A7J8MND1_9ROSI|nr:hypothetical protein [Gossypium lobatum]
MLCFSDFLIDLFPFFLCQQVQFFQRLMFPFLDIYQN